MKYWLMTKLLFTYFTHLNKLLYLNVYHLKYTRYWNYWAAYVVGIHFLFDIIHVSLQFEIFDISHFYIEYYLHFFICLVFSTIFRLETLHYYVEYCLHFVICLVFSTIFHLETSQNKIECREVWREAFGREWFFLACRKYHFFGKIIVIYSI